jgi:uroporphyrinogen-III decarboxylase
VSLQDLSYHLADRPELVNECVELLAARQRKIFELVRKAPIPYVVFPDNITAPVIGVANFEKYCVPYYNELADMLADRGVPVFVHMDGDLKPLWDAIGRSGVRGFDSLSPPPDNDTSAGQAVSLWPEMRVFLNFPSSVHLASPETVFRKTEEILEEAGHTGRLSIQISENVPPGAWRNSFPEIVKAIAAFGKPW